MALTITAANSVFTLNVPDVFTTPQTMAGYGVDDAFDTENVTPTEARKGVDAQASFGYTPYFTKLKFVLMANSPSVATMDTWIGYMVQVREVATANATIDIPSILKSYTFTNGSLTGGIIMPSAKKVLEQQTYEITFDVVAVGPLSA